MMPFLPIFVFGSLFLAFSGQTLFSSKDSADSKATNDEQGENRIIAVDLTDAELADAIAIYIKPKGDQ